MQGPVARGVGGWQSRTLQNGWPFGGQEMRPADVGNGLCSVMLAGQSVLEDVNYTKIVPNHYVVEVNQDSYRRNFQPIEASILQQWNDRMLRRLMTANSRLGRREYRFGGRVRIEIRPVDHLDAGHVRLFYKIEPEEDRALAGRAQPCLQQYPRGLQWPLKGEVVTIGRDHGCDIVLDTPEVRQARMISGRHAFLRLENGRYLIYDGAPYGRPSLNGTYVNGKPVPPDGHMLQPGDLVILAAQDPYDPRPDTPGVAAFRFLARCD